MTDPVTVTYTPIGVIHSSFAELAGMPIQAGAAQGVPGWIDLDPAYQAGLKDLDGFSHLFLIYHLHRITASSLTVTAYLDDQPHGVFATRVPKRPNPVGLSIVRLIAVKDTRLDIEDVDIVEGTPLLDIKPYVPEFDARDARRIGWFEGRAHRAHPGRADRR